MLTEISMLVDLANTSLEKAINDFVNELFNIIKKYKSGEQVGELSEEFVTKEKFFLFGLMGHERTLKNLKDDYSYDDYTFNISDFGFLPQLENNLKYIAQALSGRKNKPEAEIRLLNLFRFYLLAIRLTINVISKKASPSEYERLQELYGKIYDNDDIKDELYKPTWESLHHLKKFYLKHTASKLSPNKPFKLTDNGDFYVLNKKIGRLGPKTKGYRFLRILTDNQNEIVPYEEILICCYESSDLNRVNDTGRPLGQLCADIKHEIRKTNVDKLYWVLFRKCINAKINNKKKRGLILSLPPNPEKYLSSS